MGTLNPDTIWTWVYAALATNSATKVTDPNTTRNDPTLFIFSTMPDYSTNRYYPICILKEPSLSEGAYSINSSTKVVRGSIMFEIYALSSATLKNAVNVIVAGLRSAKNYLEIQGVKLVSAPDTPTFEYDESTSFIEGGKKFHFQSVKVNIKSTGTS